MLTKEGKKINMTLNFFLCLGSQRIISRDYVYCYIDKQSYVVIVFWVRGILPM